MGKLILGELLSQLESLELYIKNAINGSYGGNRKTKKLGSSSDFADHREYIPGDDIRKIDWHVFGRLDKFFIKQFYDERQLDIKIYLDTSASMDYGETSKAEVASKIVVALAYLAIRSMDKVSIYLLKDDKCELLCPSFVGRNAFYDTITNIENITFSGETNITKALKSVEKPGHGNGLSIVVSDFMSEFDYQEGIDYLKYHKRDVCLVRVLAAEEINPNYSGKSLLMDNESINEEDERNMKVSINRSALKAYFKALEYLTNNLKTFSSSRDIAFIDCSTADSLEEIIIKKGLMGGVIK